LPCTTPRSKPWAPRGRGARSQVVGVQHTEHDFARDGAEGVLDAEGPRGAHHRRVDLAPGWHGESQVLDAVHSLHDRLLVLVEEGPARQLHQHAGDGDGSQVLALACCLLQQNDSDTAESGELRAQLCGDLVDDGVEDADEVRPGAAARWHLVEHPRSESSKVHPLSPPLPPDFLETREDETCSFRSVSCTTVVVRARPPPRCHRPAGTTPASARADHSVRSPMQLRSLMRAYPVCCDVLPCAPLRGCRSNADWVSRDTVTALAQPGHVPACRCCRRSGTAEGCGYAFPRPRTSTGTARRGERDGVNPSPGLRSAVPSVRTQCGGAATPALAGWAAHVRTALEVICIEFGHRVPHMQLNGWACLDMLQCTHHDCTGIRVLISPPNGHGRTGEQIRKRVRTAG